MAEREFRMRLRGRRIKPQIRARRNGGPGKVRRFQDNPDELHVAERLPLTA